jgi:hypothetical protein
VTSTEDVAGPKAFSFLSPHDVDHHYYLWQCYCATKADAKDTFGGETNDNNNTTTTPSWITEIPSTLSSMRTISEHNAKCRTTRYIDVPTLSRLLSSLECFNDSSPSNGKASTQFVPLAILALIAEYSQHFQRLYAFASISEYLGASTDQYRFYIMESLPSNKSLALPLRSKDGDDSNDEMNGRLNDWRRVVMTTKAGSDAETPCLFAYRDYIISSWTGDDVIQPYLCQVPSPCIMAPPRSKDASKKPAKKGAVPIEGDDIMRVTCRRWTCLETGRSLFHTMAGWGHYRFIDIIECPSDMKEEDHMNPPSFLPHSYGHHPVSQSHHPRYWFWIAESNRIQLYSVDHVTGGVDAISSPPYNNAPYSGRFVRIVSRYEHIIYLFTQTSDTLTMITYDTFRSQWTDLTTIALPLRFSQMERAFAIPKCGIFMYSSSTDFSNPQAPRAGGGVLGSIMLYHPMSHTCAALEWTFPLWQAAAHEVQSSKAWVSSQRSMIWYNNTVLVVPLTDACSQVKNKSIEVTQCYMLAPHLITRHYTPVTSSLNGMGKNEIGEMMLTITLPQKVSLQDWIRIDDLPSYTNLLSMYATSFY